MKTAIWTRPLTLQRFALAVVVIVAVLSCAYVTLVKIAAGYSWSDMDWNEDGSTTLSELLGAGDIGSRPVVRDGHPCTEFFSLKDGSPVKVRCAA